MRDEETEQMKRILLEYVERYGLTQSARAFFLGVSNAEERTPGLCKAGRAYTWTDVE